MGRYPNAAGSFTDAVDWGGGGVDRGDSVSGRDDDGGFEDCGGGGVDARVDGGVPETKEGGGGGGVPETKEEGGGGVPDTKAEILVDGGAPDM